MEQPPKLILEGLTWARLTEAERERLMAIYQQYAAERPLEALYVTALQRFDDSTISFVVNKAVPFREL